MATQASLMLFRGGGIPLSSRRGGFHGGISMSPQFLGFPKFTQKLVYAAAGRGNSPPPPPPPMEKKEDSTSLNKNLLKKYISYVISPSSVQFAARVMLSYVLTGGWATTTAAAFIVSMDANGGWVSFKGISIHRNMIIIALFCVINILGMKMTAKTSLGLDIELLNSSEKEGGGGLGEQKMHSAIIQLAGRAKSRAVAMKALRMAYYDLAQMVDD